MVVALGAVVLLLLALLILVLLILVIANNMNVIKRLWRSLRQTLRHDAKPASTDTDTNLPGHRSTMATSASSRPEQYALVEQTQV